MAAPIRFKTRVLGLFIHGLVVALLVLGAWASHRFDYEFDWSAGKQNTLSPVSQKLLAQLDGPVKILAYASRSKKLRDRIRHSIDRFQRFKPDISLRFIDPTEAPDEVKELGIRVNGELVLQYGERSENLQTLSETAITNALYRISNSNTRWVVFLSGHGERSPNGLANHDFGQFGKQLRNKGLRILELKSAETGAIPDNASLLVIADPVVGLLEGEIEAVLDYVRAGGNLFWLVDSDELQGLDRLAEFLGIQFDSGIIVDADSRVYGINNPSMITLSSYPPHPITRNIQSISLFPKSKSIEILPGAAFEALPVLKSSTQSWSETGSIKSHVQFNPRQGEKPGPLTLGIALKGPHDDGEQRILVLGDADFLSNTYLGNGVNLDLGLSMIQWLSDRGDPIDIPLAFRPDRVLDWSPREVTFFGSLFLLVLPSLLIFCGWWVQRRRKRN